MAPNGETENSTTAAGDAMPEVPQAPASGSPSATAVMLPPPAPWAAGAATAPVAPTPPATPVAATPAVTPAPVTPAAVPPADVTLIGAPAVAPAPITSPAVAADGGAHAKPRKSRGAFWAKLIGIPAAIVVVLLGVATAGVFWYDDAQKQVMLPGVSIDGTDVGGRKLSDVKEMLNAQLAQRQGKVVTFTVDTETITSTLGNLGLTANVDAVANSALNGTDTAAPVAAPTAAGGDLAGQSGNGLFDTIYGTFNRTYHRLSNTPLNVKVTTTYEFSNPQALQNFAGGVISKINREPKDATVSVVGDGIQVTPSVAGRTADAAKILSAIQGNAQSWATADGVLKADLPVTPVAPKVTEATIGKTIYVSKDKRQLTLYDGAKVVKQYSVAIGSPAHPTPSGTFEIEEKRKNPVWINPAKSTWGASMPASIPPGPGNPLGTRAMNLNAPGIRIHGTNNVGSLGDAASHGCVRMAIPQVEELFDQVDVGTRVIIK